MPCHLHPGSGHKLKDYSIFNERYKGIQRYRKEENKKEDEPAKEEKKAEGDFQEAQRQLMVIYSRVPVLIANSKRSWHTGQSWQPNPLF